VLEYLKLFGEWIKSGRTMFIAGTVAALALFLPPYWLESVQIYSAIDHLRPLLWLVFSISPVGLAFDGGKAVFTRQRLKRRLRGLAREEQHALSHFVQAGGTSYPFPRYEVHVVGRLLMDKILALGHPAIDDRGNHNITIEPWILAYLREHQSLIGLK
jgi:hypothetical protein